MKFRKSVSDLIYSTKRTDKLRKDIYISTLFHHANTKLESGTKMKSKCR